ncbi:hypothetical protein RZR97_04860 [Hydrogenimonas thermophila]|uniref:hypothetical protein n=1 Tax=Hydrogenimonas thermophila TaxID=223786 RepID=UPI002936EC11|nr:hypothetical protein [Hydrogenimonas thermophila]WOE70905.1 hypothetical protein RZR91_04880 [Hydrogenimonas thermophila]WOE73423.1 hypothetical protein RZR97_04860 [Hydrogenimonas thermophila]
MHLKRYTFASIILIAAVSFYVYKMVSTGTYTLELLGINISLPIAVWSVVPMTLLFLASFIHILYYGFKDYLRRKRVSRDIDKLADALFWDVLKESKKHNYTDKEIRKIGVVLDMGCDNFLKVDKKKCHEHIRDAIDIVTAIKHGEFVDLKKINLDKSNPLTVQNWLNFLKAEPAKAEEILRKSESYDQKVVNEAVKIFVESANEQQLEKYAHLINNNSLIHLLDTMSKRDEKDKISLELIDKLLMQKSLSNCDYLLLARKLSKLYTPHALLSFFEKLVARDERAFKAYIFILIEFEMLDRANELLEDTQHDEYLDFKAFLDLRKAGKHYPINLLLQQC